ncbi:MAG: 4Fe-4S cluster-binding domain-containing protein [Oscillospiraceae bacterium]|nr:4Fe-4S cluster-binding domain-containing protein [Oscillospiraceae bacterium]
MKSVCTLCPRRCGAIREDALPGGFCRSPLLPQVARCAPHFGEEPCVAGPHGTGAVFFTGCNLRCVFCQNAAISRGEGGRPVTVPQLRDMLLSLRDAGVDSIDLVTGAHFIPAVTEALRGLDLGIPVVWNSSGYESVESLRLLEGLVQVYMPDYKYASSDAARRYSAAEDYPEAARAAIQEMFRQVGPAVLDDNGLLKSGVLIRHLILPGRLEDARDAIDFAADEFPAGSVLFSLMSQYTPMPGLEAFPELQRRVTPEENEALIHYMRVRGLAGFWQESEAATKDMIPDWDLTGVCRN